MVVSGSREKVRSECSRSPSVFGKSWTVGNPFRFCLGPGLMRHAEVDGGRRNVALCMIPLRSSVSAARDII
jgi:hypothetical protein